MSNFAQSRLFRAGVLVLGLGLTMGTTGCSSASDGKGSTVAPITGPNSVDLPAAPVIESFTADPPTVTEGQQTILSWKVNDPHASINIAPQADTVTGTSIAVSPFVTTTYTLTATNVGGAAVASVTVAVLPSSSASTTPTGSTTPGTTNVESAGWVHSTANLAGLASECGTMTYVSAKPDEDLLIAGIAQQGLWSSRDGGDTWDRLGQGTGSDTITNRTSAIVYDPVAPKTFWESGTYNDGGVYRSDDDGVTFHRLGKVIHSDAVAVDFNDPFRQTLLSATHEQSVVWRSIDGGKTWTNISTALPADIGYAKAPLILNKTTYLVGTGQGNGSGIFRTTDGGLTWIKVYTGGIAGRPLVASDGAFYWLLEGQGMIKSNDGGATWSTVGGGPVAADSATVTQLPDGRIVTIGGGYLITSADGGNSWQRLGPALPYAPRGFTYSSFRNAFYAWRFVCNLGGANPVADDAIVRLQLGSAGVPSTTTSTATTG